MVVEVAAVPAVTKFIFSTVLGRVLGGGQPSTQFQTGRLSAVAAAQQLGQVIKDRAASNAPPPGQSAPIPQPSPADTRPFIIGSIYWGARGPLKRLGPRGKKKKRVMTRAEWERSVLKRVPQMPAGQWEDMVQMRGPIPTIPDLMPPPAPVVTETVIGAAARWLNPLIWVFWPSKTADDDVIPNPQQLPRKPSGPLRRPRIRTPGTPGHPFEFPYDPIEVIRPYAIPGPKAVPQGNPKPKPELISRPAPIPTIQPGDYPAPKITLPKPAPVPKVPVWLEPFLPLVLQPFVSPATRVARPAMRSPLTRPLPGPLESPLAMPQLTPQRADPCNCQATKERKRKQDKCRNPIVRKTKRTKGGVMFQTITRRIQCQA